MNNKENQQNPWKGLDFYTEGDPLYGRDDDIRRLSQHIFNNSITILLGKSGIGKTSILNAGVFPLARKQNLSPIGIRLDHSNTDSYIKQIKNAIEKGEKHPIEVIERLPAINEEEETLWEYLHRNTFINEKAETTELLLVFDQFEEIFTLQKNKKKKEGFFQQLADLINSITPSYIVEEQCKKNNCHFKDKDDSKENVGEIVHQRLYIPEDRFHIVITIREDYLSYLEKDTKFIPAMKYNRYALQPLNEEQAEEIIMKPREGLVDKKVARKIIENITGRKDFEFGDEAEVEVDAAILSLYMSSLYEAKTGDKITEELIEEKIDGIIYNFYKDAIAADISPQSVVYLEDNLINGLGCRENVTLHDAKVKGHVTDEELYILIEKKKILRKFHYAKADRIELIHDVLCNAVKKHNEERVSFLEKIRYEKRIKNLIRLTILIIIIAVSAVLYISKENARLQYNQDDFLIFTGGGSVQNFIKENTYSVFDIGKMNLYPNTCYLPSGTGNLWGMIAEEYFYSKERVDTTGDPMSRYQPIFLAASPIDTAEVSTKIPHPDSIWKNMLIIELYLGKDITTIYSSEHLPRSFKKGDKHFILDTEVLQIIKDAYHKHHLYTTSQKSGTYGSFKNIVFHDKNNYNKSDSLFICDTIFNKKMNFRKEFHLNYEIPNNSTYLVLGSQYYYPRFTDTCKYRYYISRQNGSTYSKDLYLYFCAYNKDGKYIIPKGIRTFLRKLTFCAYNKDGKYIILEGNRRFLRLLTTSIRLLTTSIRQLTTSEFFIINDKKGMWKKIINEENKDAKFSYEDIKAYINNNKKNDKDYIVHFKGEFSKNKDNQSK